MNGPLALASVAVVVLTAMLLSLLVGGALPLLDRMAAKLTPQSASCLWLGLGALPLLAAVAAALVTLWPSLAGDHHHCLAHEAHHPHLCLLHLGGAPGILVWLLAVGGIAWALRSIGQTCVHGWMIARTHRALVDASRPVDASLPVSALPLESEGSDAVPARVFTHSTPQAFVLGLRQPTPFVSSALLAQAPELLVPVLAHERAHLRHRHDLWRLFYPLVALGHLSPILRRLSDRLAQAQEMEADRDAVRCLADSETSEAGALKTQHEMKCAALMAQALVRLAQLVREQQDENQPPVPSHLPIAGAMQGDLHARVHALLKDPSETVTSSVAALSILPAFLPFLLPVLAIWLQGPVHHAMETLLGAFL